MQNPDWFGNSYPDFHTMLGLAEENRIGVGFADVPFGLYYPNIMGVRVIVIPNGVSPLMRIWALAHELGHAFQHSGAKGSLSYRKEEVQASRWAAQALIPIQRICMYQNASIDAFIGALSAHYEDIPFEDCPARDLAASIAKYRLSALAQEVA
ncbi:ImmA/IrrE family metallo-endopeptidase [Mesoterricola sediminis]|uniref:ImmA/IrrE family metallo-endopeptidase n=1 Tax=Mesoterricola sediminis TaxID=2927980 RepID=UPI00292F7C95|nr:ImmA/IrrE family metallo-endopeptidase [Mesoterricola sediminis]